MNKNSYEKVTKNIIKIISNKIKNIYIISMAKISIYIIESIITNIDPINWYGIILLNNETPIKILTYGLIGVMIWRFNGIKNLKTARVEKKKEIDWLNEQSDDIKYKKYGEWNNIEIRKLELKALDKHITEKEAATESYYMLGLLLSMIWLVLNISKNDNDNSDLDN